MQRFESNFLDFRSEVSQVSVGPTGMTWAVTWHGKALVRLGVTRLDPTGKTQISANRGTDSRFVLESNLKSL